MPRKPITEGDVNNQSALLYTVRQLSKRVDELEAELRARTQASIANDVTAGLRSALTEYVSRALTATGTNPLNVEMLQGVLANSQRAFAVVASTAASLPDPTGMAIGTLGAVISGTSLTFYTVIAGVPQTWLAQTSIVITTIDNTFTIQDDVDPTKKIRFEASTITTATTRVMTVPDIDQILAGRNVNNNFTVSQTIANALDANLLLTVQDTNASGTAAAGAVRAAGDSATINILGHGTARTVARCGITLGAWTEIFVSAGAGLLIDVAGNFPTVFGTNNVERMRLDATGLQITAGTLRFSTAASQIVPGATSLALRNNANSANNVLITDAGAVTIRDLLTALKGLTVSGGETSLTHVTNPLTTNYTGGFGAVLILDIQSGGVTAFEVDSDLNARVYQDFTVDRNLRVGGNIGVGNSATATTAVGALAKKIEIFDASGTSLGFLPVYATIT